MTAINTRRIMKALNILEFLGIALVLAMAIYFQFVLKELPCPLCLLQRVGFLGVAFALLLNMKFGLRPSHYALAILSAMFTAFVALRQIALHVVPGSGSYGSAFLGLHMYTWSFVLAMLIIFASTIILSMDAQYDPKTRTKKAHKVLTHVLFAILAVLLVVNIVTVLLECGLSQCPDNPTSYLLSML